MAKLDAVSYKDRLHHYLDKIDKGIELEKVLYFIDKDIEDSKQSQTMTKAVIDKAVEMDEQREQKLLESLHEVFGKPNKWVITSNHNVATSHPHPVIKNGRVKGHTYKPEPYYFEDDELFNRYIEYVDSLTPAITEVEGVGEVEVKQGRRYNSPDAHDVAWWVELKQQGYKYTEIARLFNETSYTVNTNVKKVLKGGEQHANKECKSS